MFQTIYSQVGVALTVLVITFVLIKGEEPERIGGAAFVMVVLAGMTIPSGESGGLEAWGRMALDLILLGVFAGLAFRTSRQWPIWAAAFQSLIVTGHFIVLVDLQPPSDAFAAVNNMANYGLLIALTVGTFWAWQERRAARLAERPGPHL